MRVKKEILGTGKKEHIISFRIEDKFYQKLNKIAAQRTPEVENPINKLSYDLLVGLISPEIIKDASKKKFKEKHKENIKAINDLMQSLIYKTDFLQIHKESELKKAINNLKEDRKAVLKDNKKLMSAVKRFNKVYNENIVIKKT